MLKRSLTVACLAATALSTQAQTVVFDFDGTPAHSPLPISLTVGGITANFSATGSGFSIQPADTLGFTPVGFAGNCIYPDSVSAADLLVSFSQPLTSFAILYAPEELGCDSSARMRVTAYLDALLVGTATTNASVPGTWPTEWLRYNSTAGFNRVVVHYDAPPACQDYGPVFMADNMEIVPAPPPIVLSGAAKLADGSFQFFFTNSPGASCRVWSTTNVSQAITNWGLAGTPIEQAPGTYVFTEPATTYPGPRFYRVTSP